MDPMEDLASFISSNFMGMGKSAADALPELRRAGVTASGSSFSLGGKLMGAPEIAQVLRLQVRVCVWCVSARVLSTDAVV